MHLSWLVLVVVALVGCPRAGAQCWDICNNLSYRFLDCIHLCASVMQADISELRSLAMDSSEENIPLELLLATTVTRGKVMQRSQARSEDRRSYAMKHFRWGKPPGRKRRPVKVYTSSMEDEDLSEEGFPVQKHRQLGRVERESMRDVEAHEKQEERLGLKANAPQERKDGTYRMTHFRWGSPPSATKRHSNFMRLWEEVPQNSRQFMNRHWRA